MISSFSSPLRLRGIQRVHSKRLAVSHSEIATFLRLFRRPSHRRAKIAHQKRCELFRGWLQWSHHGPGRGCFSPLLHLHCKWRTTFNLVNAFRFCKEVNSIGCNCQGFSEKKIYMLRKCTQYVYKKIALSIKTYFVVIIYISGEQCFKTTLFKLIPVKTNCRLDPLPIRPSVEICAFAQVNAFLNHLFNSFSFLIVFATAKCPVNFRELKAYCYNTHRDYIYFLF